MEDLYFEAEST